MKINRNNQDFKIINRNRGCNCLSCAFDSHDNLIWCALLCRSGKIWTGNIFNSDIFRL